MVSVCFVRLVFAWPFLAGTVWMVLLKDDIHVLMTNVIEVIVHSKYPFNLKYNTFVNGFSGDLLEPPEVSWIIIIQLIDLTITMYSKYFWKIPSTLWGAR